jgi:hypothetical protein
MFAPLSNKIAYLFSPPPSCTLIVSTGQYAWQTKGHVSSLFVTILELRRENISSGIRRRSSRVSYVVIECVSSPSDAERKDRSFHMSHKTEIIYPSSSRLIRMTRGAIYVEYVTTCIHHVDEGLGFAFGFFRLNSLLTPLTFGIPLLITLGLLYLYQKTSHRFVLVVFGITTILWWVIGIGIEDGFYNHTLSVLLFLVGVPLQIVRKIYPTYPISPISIPLTHPGILTIPCDGVQFRFCALTPNTVLYEGTGIFTFVVACFLTLAVYRLIRATWRNQHAKAPALPRMVAVGISLGLVASFAVLPLLGSFMSTGRLSFLISALPIMGISVLALVVAIVWLRRKNPDQPLAHIASLGGEMVADSPPEETV